MPGTSGGGGMPPGTSGLRSRGGLRTGAQGPGTMAAQGNTILANLDALNRPTTGVNQGVMGMKTSAMGQGRLVQDASYYIGLLRKKITETTNETNRMRTELEQQSKDNAQYSSLEQKYEKLLKSKEKLEGDLADYNLALDKTRTATDRDTVQEMVNALHENNRKLGEEIDRLFMLRKQRENDCMQTENQIDQYYKQVQQRLSDLDPRRLQAYNDLLNKQKDLQREVAINENRITDVNERIRRIEGEEKGGMSHRKDYLLLEKQINVVQLDLDTLNEELEIATGSDGSQAHKKFVERVNTYKESAKQEEAKASNIRTELEELRKSLHDLNSNTTAQEDPEETAKFELLQKRDKDMSEFMDKFEESKGAILDEQGNTRNTIVMLLEHISRDIEDSATIDDASRQAMGEMEAAKNFKQKNLQTAQRTMESLQAERRKRERELEMLKSSEPKLAREVDTLTKTLKEMRGETKAMSDIDGLRRKFDKTKNELHSLSDGYNRRRTAMQQQVLLTSQEVEMLKKQLAGSETAKELEESEKQLKRKEETVFDLKEFIDSKTRDTEYEGLKNNCLKTIEILNTAAVKASDGYASYAQAKY